MPRSHRDRYLVPGSGTRCSVPPTTPGKPGTVTTPGILIIPGSPSSTVTPGESVRPVHSGQEAQLEKADQCLAQSELPVLNSPVRSVQLEHYVHHRYHTVFLPSDVFRLILSQMRKNKKTEDRDGQFVY